MPADLTTGQERDTATELARLDATRWFLRDDAADHDQIVAGASVYVLTTKNVRDAIVSIESGAPKVSLVDHPGATYRARPWIEAAHEAARRLEQRLDNEAGFPVAVSPVIVLWGSFDAGHDDVDDVSLVHGSKLVEWLESRPMDLRTAGKRDAIRRCVQALPTR